ncbi:uncharacterized protein LOC131435442 [Malaya genurostris]|uniref:uncharacterized protein LOC131435442 n=1 Tax=Malaya genurostris TaxID=325434 RepID=UPI0026F3BA68|nr:uncharacterized protein LOC131435442 [Malaya genurostris]XP_058459320.1 uncharacterized protein LOC131435442 [Malaya genurostris]
MAATAENVKLPDLITKWMEVQKLRAGLDEHATSDLKPLKVDAIDLTLLLKSMGLKLEYLDFEQDKSNTDTLIVEIKCNRSGVVARMSYDLVDCSCPEKDEKETSFWEVQATGPQVFSKFKNNTSSNLLPEVSENCSMVSKAMLSNLLDYYRSSMKSIEQGEDVLQSPLKIAMPKICITSPGLGRDDRTTFVTPPAEGKFMALIESVSSPEAKNTNHSESSPVKAEPTEESNSCPTPSKIQEIDNKSNNSTESVGIDNATRDISNSDPSEKSTVENVVNAQETKIPDDSFANSEAMKALITSSPNEKVFEDAVNLDQNHERDLNVIHCLQVARHEIDAALLVMKLNNPSRLLPQISAITTTPQTVIRKRLAIPKLPERANSLTNINRRMSLPGHAGDSQKTTPNSAPNLQKKNTTVTSKLATTKPVARGDTPRPTAAQLKTAAILRKTNTATSTSSTVNSGSVTKSNHSVLKKSVPGIKPIGSVRPTPNVTAKPALATVIGRSKSSVAIDKK